MTKYEIFKDVNIPNSEIFKAVQRHNAAQLEPMTRSSSDEQACLHGCYTSYLANSGDCEKEYERLDSWAEGGVNNGEWNDGQETNYLDWCDYRGCIMSAEIEYDNCVSMCG